MSFDALIRAEITHLGASILTCAGPVKDLRERLISAESANQTFPCKNRPFFLTGKVFFAAMLIMEARRKVSLLPKLISEAPKQGFFATKPVSKASKETFCVYNMVGKAAKKGFSDPKPISKTSKKAVLDPRAN